MDVSPSAAKWYMQSGFEITLDEHNEYISGHIDMNADAYGGKAEQVINYIIDDLNSLNSN